MIASIIRTRYGMIRPEITARLSQAMPLSVTIRMPVSLLSAVSVSFCA